MRDYLEALLEEQVQEQGEDSPGVLLLAESGPIRRRRAAGAEQALPEGSERETSASGENGSVRTAPAAEKALERGDPAEEPGLKYLRPDSAAVPGLLAMGRGVPPEDEGEMVRQDAEAGSAGGREEERELPEPWGMWDGRSGRSALSSAPEPRRKPSGDGGAWLDQKLRQGAAAVEYAGRETGGGTWTEPAELAAGGGLTPAELDRALERDARRYDRGFTLF